MIFIKKITSSIESLSTKHFYLYSGIYVGVIFLVHILLIFWHFSTINTLQEQLDEINTLRQTKLQPLLIRTQQVRQQHKEVDALLAQDPNFKLNQVIEDMLTELKLDLKTHRPTHLLKTTERQEKYLETVLDMKLIDINMQLLTEFLEKIENNPRINANSIEITKSKKKPNTVEVSLTIAALQPKE